MLPESKLTKNQKKTVVKIKGHEKLVIKLRHDDECGNGHNTFAVTADLHEKAKNGLWVWQAGGCLHNEIAQWAPDIAPFIKWHLCSTDGPMHYIANSMYHASDKDCWGRRKGKEPDLEAARSCAIWPEATLEDFTEEKLLARLPALMQEFKAAVEALGFEY